jgi:hypothetical protein
MDIKNYLKVFLLIFTCSAYPQQYSLQGRIFDSGNKEVLIGVKVRLLPAKRETSTGINGQYMFDSLSAGVYLLKAFYIGYQEISDTIEISDKSGNIVNDIYMTPEPQPAITYTDTIISGRYNNFVKYNAVQPCNSRERWWVIGNSELYNKYKLILSKISRNHKPYNYHTEVFVTLKGKVSSIGIFGRRGGFLHQFIVEKVLEMRPLKENDCKKGSARTQIYKGKK